MSVLFLTAECQSFQSQKKMARIIRNVNDAPRVFTKLSLPSEDGWRGMHHVGEGLFSFTFGLRTSLQNPFFYD